MVLRGADGGRVVGPAVGDEELEDRRLAGANGGQVDRVVVV